MSGPIGREKLGAGSAIPAFGDAPLTMSARSRPDARGSLAIGGISGKNFEGPKPSAFAKFGAPEFVITFDSIVTREGRSLR
jgi:hypothetical protein